MTESLEHLLAGLHPLERKVLEAMKSRPSLWDHELMQASGLDESRLSMAMGWLLAKAVARTEEEKTTPSVSVTELGRKYAAEGIPEKRILTDIQSGKKLSIKDLREPYGLDPQEVSTAIGNLRSRDHEIVRVGAGGLLEPTGLGLPGWVECVLPAFLSRLAEGGGPVQEADLMEEERHLLNDLLEKQWKTRGIVKRHEKKSKRFGLTDSGRNLAERLTPEESPAGETAQLTPDLLKDGAWRGVAFRKYTIGLKPSRI
ncbi:MAG TPA: hypothetical protein VI702_06060, partial [Nitrospiria bacterium]